MPLSKYNRFFGGKSGSAQKAHDSMIQHYMAQGKSRQEAESIFYATKNRNANQGKGRGMRGVMEDNLKKRKRGRRPPRRRSQPQESAANGY